MNPSDNKSALSLLVDDTFTIELTTSKGQKIPVELRELPANLLFDIVNVVIQQAGAGALEATPEISAKMATLISFTESLTKKDAANDSDRDEQKRVETAGRAANIAAIVGSVLPIALRVLPQVPEVMERLLLACIVDATPQLVKVFKAKDAFKVINAVMKKIDADEFAESLASFFDQATALWKSAAKQRASIPSTENTKPRSHTNVVPDQA